MASSIGNVNDFCRLCACEAINGVVIYSSEGLHLCLEEKIIQCLRIEVSKDDMLPKNVCCPCRSRLEESHRFAEQANKVQHTLELLIQKNFEQNIDVKLEEELDIKDEIDQFPLDVTIDSDHESEATNQYKSYYVTGEEPYHASENQTRNGVVKKVECSNKYTSRRKMQQPQRADSGLRSNEQEKSQSTISSLFSPCSSSFTIFKGAEKIERDEEQEKTEEEVQRKQESEEKEEDCEGEENEKEMKNVINVTESHTDYETFKSDRIRSSTENVEEEDEDDDDEEEKETDKIIREEWKTHWGIKCNECDEVFPYRSQFDKHYQGSYNKKPIYTCSYCNKTMEKYSTFRSHCYRHVTEGRYRCEYCQKGFSLRSMLHVHILAKHTTVKPFICEECGKGFVTRPGLNIHLKKHKTNEKQEYPCSECGKILRTRGGLTTHENVHRLGRRFMCDICGKTFTQKVNLQQHHKAHTGERPFVCQRCGKRFAEKSHLNRHHSFHSEKRPFQCTVCLKMYKTERCLKVHAMVHSEARPYVCSYCNKGFLSSTKLKQHYNIHTGERPYACKFCERTFTNYPNWLKHTRRRHKDYMHLGSNVQNTSPQTPVCAQDPLQQQQHELYQHQHTEQDPSNRNSFNSGPVSLQTRLSDTTSLMEEACMDPSNASSMGLVPQYLGSGHTKSVQSLSPHKGQKCPPVVTQEPEHHNSMEQTFPIPQVYPEHLVHMSHPHSILPL